MAGISYYDFCYILKEGNSTEQDDCYNCIASACSTELRRLIYYTTEYDPKRRTVLHLTAKHNDARFFRLFVEKGSTARYRDAHGTNPLMIAAKYSTEIVLYMLQELGCSDIINEQDWKGWTALHIGIKYSSAVGLLLKHGADPNMTENDHGATPLQRAAYTGTVKSAELLLDYGANLNVTDRRGWNAMHCAAENSNDSFVQWLFDIGARDMMLARDNNGMTPLDLAIEENKCEYYQVAARKRVVELLLKHFKDKVAAEEGDLCLHYILRTVVNTKLRTVVLPVGTRSVKQMLALMLELVTLFVSVQANPIATVDEKGALPLHVACQNSNTPIEVIQFLVEQDPGTVRRRDNQGNLPIHSLCASQPPRLKTIMYLHSKHEGSVMLTNHQGRSPFMMAALASASLNVLWYLIQANPAAAVAMFRRSSSKML